MLDAKKQVVGTHRSGKHNLQHPYAPKFPIFHEKNGKKWPLFGLKLSFSASDRQHENPLPYFEGAGCKKAGSRERQITKTQFIAYIFHEKTAKNGRFWSKIEFFGLRQAFEDPPPPISTVLDAKKQVLGRHRSRKHNLQHAYAPTFVIFHEKKRPRMAVFWSKIEFFGARQAFEDPPPPILRVLDAKKQVVRAHRRRKHNLQHLYVPKLPIFHEKSAKNGRFLVKN